MYIIQHSLIFPGPVAGTECVPLPGQGRRRRWVPGASQLPAPGREVNGHSHRMFCSLHLAMSIYGSNHEQRINVSYCMDSAIALDSHSASAERVDSSSVLVAKVSYHLHPAEALVASAAVRGRTSGGDGGHLRFTAES